MSGQFNVVWFHMHVGSVSIDCVPVKLSNKIALPL